VPLVTAGQGRVKWARWVGCVVFLLALVLRLGAAVGDLPHVYDFDERLFMDLEIGPMFSERTLEPQGYGHPALYKDVSVTTLMVVGGLAGWDKDDVSTGSGIVGDRLVRNPMPWFTLRTLVALLGAVAVVMVWDSARRLGVPNWAAGLAAGIGAVAPVLLGAPQRVASDGYSVFFAMTCVWLLARVVQRPSLRRQAALGVAIGLVMSAKYNGAPLALLALVVPLTTDGSWRRRVGWVLAAGGAAAAAFVITNPYSVLHPDSAWQGIVVQNKAYSFYSLGNMGRTPLFNLRTLLDDAGPMAALALAAVPMAAVAWRRAGTDSDSRTANRSTLVAATGLLVGIAGWLTLIGRYEVREARNVMALVLPVCVLGALGLQAWSSLWPRPRNASVLAALVLLGSGWAGVQVSKGAFEWGRVVADERADARGWLEGNVQPGQRLVGEVGTPYLGRSDVVQETIGNLAELDLDELRTRRTQWVVTSSGMTEGVVSDQARWGDQIADYQRKLAGVCEWHTFQSWNTETSVGVVCPLNDLGVNSGLAAG